MMEKYDEFIADGSLALRFDDESNQYTELIVLKDSNSRTSSRHYTNLYFENIAKQKAINIKKIIYSPDANIKILSDKFAGEHTEHNILDSVEEVVLPKGLEEICTGCFSHLKGLKKVIIPDSVKQIHAGAFEDCTGLIRNGIVYGSSENNPYKWAISCERYDLEEIELNKQTEIISEHCFYLNELSRFKDNLKLKKILIPKNIHKIGRCAFGQISSLEEVVFEEGSLLKELPEWAFYKCVNLRSIKFSTTLETVNEWAFHSCISLKYLDLSFVKQIIGDSVFYNTPSLKKVVFGKNLQLIKGCVFSIGENDCKPIDCFEFDSKCRYENVDGIIYDKYEKKAMYYTTPNAELKVVPGTKIINDYFIDFTYTTKKLINYNYHSNRYRKFTIPEGVEVIGASAFRNCGIEILNLPSTLKKIGSFCFRENHIYEVNLFSSTMEIGKDVIDNFTYYPYFGEYTSYYYDDEKAKKGLIFNIIDLNKSMNDEIIIGGTLIKYININDNKFYEVPKHIKKINGSCFKGTQISTIVLHENIETINGAIEFNYEDKNSKTIYYNCINATVKNEEGNDNSLVYDKSIKIIVGKYVQSLPIIYEGYNSFLDKIEYDGTISNFRKIYKNNISDINQVECCDGVFCINSK